MYKYKLGFLLHFILIPTLENFIKQLLD